MADIDNLKGGTKRTVDEESLDNLRGGTKRTIQVNSIDNTKGGVKRVYVVGGGAPAPTGTIYIISNGTYNVADKAIANVNVPTTAPDRYVEYVLDSQYGWLNNTLDTTKFNNLVAGVTQLKYYQLAGICYNNQNIGAIDLSSLQYLSNNSLAHSFRESSITSLDLSNITEISGFAMEMMCYSCSSLTNVNVSSVRSMSGTSALANAFASCTALSEVKWSSLISISGSGFPYTFGGCNNIVLWFPNIMSVVNNSIRWMLRSASGGNVQNAVVHFPSNMETAVKALGSYSDTAAFGAASSTVLFDLPATVTLTGADTVSYQRNPKYDTAAALGWRVIGDTDWNPVYTSGTTDPQVNDTIYSDAACTTPVTTISSIA